VASMEAIAFQVVRSGNLSLLRRLLDTTPDIITARDSGKRTLLHVAAAEDQVEICAELIARDPECLPFVRDDACQVPLEVASVAVKGLLEAAQREAGDPAPALSGFAAGASSSSAGASSAASAAASAVTAGADEAADHGSAAQVLEEEPTLGLSLLPMDVCEMVLSQCLVRHGLGSLLRVSETCHRLREISSSDALWETLCWQDFKLQRRSVVSGSWREMYVEHSLLHASVKGGSLRGRKSRHADRRERAGLRSTVSQGAVEGTIWGIGNVRVSVEGTIWDTSSGDPSGSDEALPGPPRHVLSGLGAAAAPPPSSDAHDSTVDAVG
jgi:hypothetical protein